MRPLNEGAAPACEGTKLLRVPRTAHQIYIHIYMYRYVKQLTNNGDEDGVEDEDACARSKRARSGSTLRCTTIRTLYVVHNIYIFIFI